MKIFWIYDDDGSESSDLSGKVASGVHAGEYVDIKKNNFFWNIYLSNRFILKTDSRVFAKKMVENNDF